MLTILMTDVLRISQPNQKRLQLQSVCLDLQLLLSKILTQFHSRVDLLHVLRHLLQPNVQQARHRQALPSFPAALQVRYYFFHISFQNISFQNRAQDEYHKCHTIGEIYFQLCQLNPSHRILLFYPI